MLLKEMIDARKKAFTDASSAWDKANADGRTPNGEDETAWRSAQTEYDRYDKLIEIEERKLKMEGDMRAREEREAELRKSAGRHTRPGEVGQLPGGDGASLEVRSASGRLLKPHEIKRNSPEHRSRYAKWLCRAANQPLELRALQMDSDILGGYLIPPQQFVDELIVPVKNYTFIYDLCRRMMVDGAQSLGIPTLEVDISAPSWTTEIADASSSADSSMSFGKRELKPSMLVKLIKISNELLQRTGRAESLVQDRLGYQFAVAQENGFLTGNGVNQPLGVFTAGSATIGGIPTSRDTTSAANNAIVGDDLLNTVYTLKQPYQNDKTCTWIMSRAIAQVVRKIKDSQNRYMWEPSIQSGQPAMLLNYPIRMSEYAPSQSGITASTYAAILGCFGYYYVAEVEGDEGLSLQRLDELYAATNQTGYIARAKIDGMPVLAEAFARLKIHS